MKKIISESSRQSSVTSHKRKTAMSESELSVLYNRHIYINGE